MTAATSGKENQLERGKRLEGRRGGGEGRGREVTQEKEEEECERRSDT